MFLSDPGEGAFGALKDLLLELEEERELSALLPLVVRRLAESSSDVALARIWLLGNGDACATCRNAPRCASREQCLHLAASAERPRGGRIGVAVRAESAFRRIPIGALKVGRVFAESAAVVVPDAASDPHIARPDWVSAEGIQTFVGQPLNYRDQRLGVLGVFVRQRLTQAGIDTLRLLANHAAAAIASARAFDEIARLQRLQRESEPALVAVNEVSSLVGSSAPVLQLQREIDLVAPTAASVLVTGESGTGKELVARAIHERSRRASMPFILVNCAAISRELYESEFFGHCRGSFSGATRDRIGRFEAANGGTLFLDEVGEIPIDLQGKLLRVLQEGTFERLGETHSRRVDVRIVAATNRELSQEVAAGRFRQDLFYRLNVFPILTPPLRERREDIAVIAAHLTLRVCERMQRTPLSLGPEAIAALEAHDWPGNVRELRNVVERAVITTPAFAKVVERVSLPGSPRAIPSPLPPPASEPAKVISQPELRRLERDNIATALAASGGRISGPGGAAELLGLRPTTLASRLKKLGLRGP